MAICSCKPVQSAGGMQVTPDGALTKALAAESDALILVGGTIWREILPDIAAFLKVAKSHGTLIAAICDATRALAGAGFLNNVKHTANDADTLDVPGYEGDLRFSQSSAAIRDERIVTAPGTGPVSFMAEVLRGLGLGDANLDFYVGMMAAEHGAMKRAA